MTLPPSDWLDLRHAATDRPIIVVVGERRLLAIDGVGAPTGSDYRLASETLRAGLRMLHRPLAGPRPASPRPTVLETAWWTHPELPTMDLPDAFEDRSTWHWQQMVEMPKEVTDAEIDAAIRSTQQAAGRSQPLMRPITLIEGRAAQMLHLGGASAAPRTLRTLFTLLAADGLRPRGHIHELRIAEEGTVPTDRVRSILRIPIESDLPS